MKKILIVSAVFPPEPVVSATISYDIAEMLSRSYDVTVVSPKASRPLGYNFENLTKIDGRLWKHHVLNSFVYPESKILGRLYENISFGIHTFYYIINSGKEYDVIYVNTWPIISQLLTLFGALIYKIPVIFHIQDVYPESLLKKISLASRFVNYLFFSVDKYILMNCSKVVTISEGMKLHLVKTRGLDPSKIDVVHNWQDDSRFLDVYDSRKSKKEFTFLFLGSISPAAAIEVNINAFIKANLSLCRLKIAGKGADLNKLKALVSNSNCKNIDFIDAPFCDVPKIQSHADVLLISLKKGGGGVALPSKLPAYMFSAKPIIGSVDQDSDTAKAIIRSKCGWVVPPESVEDLSRVMIEAYQKSVVERNEMGLRGQKYALDHFSKSKNLPKLVNLIDGLITK